MRYKVDVYYSGYVTVEVDADEKGKALELGRNKAIDYHLLEPEDFHFELDDNLEHWWEADTVEELEV